VVAKGAPRERKKKKQRSRKNRQNREGKKEKSEKKRPRGKAVGKRVRRSAAVSRTHVSPLSLILSRGRKHACRRPNQRVHGKTLRKKRNKGDFERTPAGGSPGANYTHPCSQRSVSKWPSRTHSGKKEERLKGRAVHL